MNKKNTKKLNDDFPFLRPKGGLMHSLMYFGFMCDDGWFKLIYQLCKDIQRVIDNNPDHKLDDFIVIEVKEKFGGLRFYAGSYNKEIGELIDKAEHESEHTCEICGKRGSLSVHGGWYKTCCPKHRKSRGYIKVKPWKKCT